MQGLTSFIKTTEGLRIELNDTPSAKEDIQEVREKFESGEWTYEQAWWELCESPLCNGYNEVKPETIAALTSAPIIADSIIDEETTQEDFERTNIWAFMDYMVRDELRELLDKGFVVFPLIQKAK